MTTLTTATPTSTDAEVAALTKRAFAYLRVSSDGQVNTGYSRDGLSIDSQRDEAQRKAAQLDAEIVRFFLDPGKSAFVDLHKRTDFLEMLEEVKRCNECEATRIDYVIVWATDRWARDVRVHFDAHDMVRATGARLVSITEPMIGDDTPEAFYFEGIRAVSNQYESMRTGRAVKGGLYRKAMAGGSYGGRRLGYIKVIEQLPDGRQIGGIAPDPERHAFVTYAFQLYDSGEYSIPQLVDELHRLGLRSLPDKRYAAGKVGTSAMQRLLRNPYYAGLIVYKRGTADEQVVDGRHPALIDRETFDRVQKRLDEKRTAGERPQIHRHYLKGSVFCGSCGQRLSFGVSTGRNGFKYPYFFCSARINGTYCEMRANIRPELIEQAIQRHYRDRPVQLTAQEVADRTGAIEALAAVSNQAVQQVRRAKTDLIAKLKAQQKRLIRLHAEEGDDVSGDAFREERTRMAEEIKAAETSLAETELRLSIETAQLKLALELAEDAALVYASADEITKRGYNQAFFTKLFVTAEWDANTGQTTAHVSADELTQPYAVLLDKRLVAKLKQATKQLQAAKDAEGDPQRPPSDAAVSIFVKLAGRSEQNANLEGALERLLEHLMEPVGRQARRRAAEAIRQATR